MSSGRINMNLNSSRTVKIMSLYDNYRSGEICPFCGMDVVPNIEWLFECGTFISPHLMEADVSIACDKISNQTAYIEWMEDMLNNKGIKNDYYEEES